MADPIYIVTNPASPTHIALAPLDADPSMLDVTLPSARVGDELLIPIVRDAEVLCSDPAWTKYIDGFGAAGLFLDIYRRRVDGTSGSREGDVVSFLSTGSQVLQGGPIVVESPDSDNLIEASAHGAFLADSNPSSPNVDSTRRLSLLVAIWSSSGDLDMTPPVGWTMLDTFSSETEAASRTILLATRTAGVVGTQEPAQIAASAPATGRAFSLVITYKYRGSAHSAREHGVPITNPSRHARKTP